MNTFSFTVTIAQTVPLTAAVMFGIRAVGEPLMAFHPLLMSTPLMPGELALANVLVEVVVEI